MEHWSKSFKPIHFTAAELIINDYYSTKGNFGTRKSLNYKNRFVRQSYTVSNKLANFFVFKGFKLKYLKLFNYASLCFFWNTNNINTPLWFFKHYKYENFVVNLPNYPQLNKIIKDSAVFHTFNTIVPYFLLPELPMIKAVCLKKKIKKKKKVSNPKKYSLRYAYVPHSQRLAVSFRWFSMLVKVTNKPLINSYVSVILNTSTQTEESMIIQIRNQVYAGLAAEQS